MMIVIIKIKPQRSSIISSIICLSESNLLNLSSVLYPSTALLTEILPYTKKITGLNSRNDGGLKGPFYSYLRNMTTFSPPYHIDKQVDRNFNKLDKNAISMSIEENVTQSSKPMQLEDDIEEFS